MGQKVNPNGFRLGVIREHNSVWYADKVKYRETLKDDVKIRDFISKELAQAFVSRIEIKRPSHDARVTIHTSRPGMVIGQRGADVERLRAKLQHLMGYPVSINVEEIRKPELDAYLVASNIAQQLERRVQYRRAARRVLQNAMRLGAQGIKVRVSGRLNGQELARSEVYSEGRVPLHTLRADIDYAVVEAMTTYGVLGVKVWIFKGEVIGESTDGAGASQRPT